MKISKIDPPVKGIDTYFIFGDSHTDAIHWPSLDIMAKRAHKLPKSKRNLIINGDFMDAAHLMARNPMYKKWIKRADGMEEYFIEKSEEELEFSNKLLDILQGIFAKIIYGEGNHDWRYRDFMAKCPPDYAHHFDYRKILRLDQRGIDYYNYNDWLDIGDHLSITHGMYHGTTAHKKHYEASGGKSVIFSHVHYTESRSFSVRGNTRKVWSLPAFCSLNPEYIKNRETNWSNGHGEIYVREDGLFNFNTYQNWNNKLALANKIIEGNDIRAIQ
jgi:ribosomal protein L24E